MYGLQILEEGIEDDKGNYTRFLVLSKYPSVPESKGLAHSYNSNLTTVVPCKTSIVFSLIDEAGILFKALSVFMLRNIDFTKIESRPGRKHLLLSPVQENSEELQNSAVVSLNKELRYA